MAIQSKQSEEKGVVARGEEIQDHQRRRDRNFDRRDAPKNDPPWP